MKIADIQLDLIGKYELDESQSLKLASFLKTILNQNHSKGIVSEPATIYSSDLDNNINTSKDINDFGPHSSTDMTSSMISSELMTDLTDLYADNTRSLLDSLINKHQIGPKFLAEKVFEMTQNTFRVYRNELDKEMPARLKEIGFALVELYNKGIFLFANKETFETWLNNEQYGLGYKNPSDMVNTMTGIQLIMEELIRIEYGATA